MNTRALFPLLFTVASFSASAGNWAVKNGWCQTMTEDGQALVMLKNGTIGITGLMQGCPNGVQTLLGSRISINGNLIPTSQMCNQQTGFRAVEVEIGQAPEMVKKAVHSIAERDVSVLQAFGVRMEFTRGDMLKVCPKFVTSLAGFSPKQTTTINKDSVLQAARQAYARKYDEETTETADFGSYEVKGNKVEFEVFNPEDRAYDKVTVTVGADGITVTQNSPTGQTMTTDAEAAVSEALRGLAFWLYRQLENEYDWLTSDAAVDEALLINEYTFTEAGLRAG